MKIFLCLFGSFFLLTAGCSDAKELFLKGEKVAYWEILECDQRLTGYGYTFHEDGRLDYFARKFRGPGPKRVVMGYDDVVDLESGWRWNKDTLFLKGIPHLIFPIHRDTILVVNSNNLDLSWWVFSEDQSTELGEELGLEIEFEKGKESN